MADNTKTTIAILGLIGIGFVLGYDLSGLKKMFFGGDEPPPNWQVEQDSLRSELDREKIAHLNDLKLYTDSLKAYTDSAVQVMPPAPVVKERAWKFFEFAPLQQATDTLDTE